MEWDRGQGKEVGDKSEKGIQRWKVNTLRRGKEQDNWGGGRNSGKHD